MIKHYVCMSTRPITNVDMNIFNQLGHCKCLNLTSNPVVQNIQKLFLMEYACYTIQSHSDNMTVQYQQSGDQQHKTVHQWVSSVSKKLKSRREMIRISNLNSMLCYECFTWHHEVWCHKVFKSCIQRVVKCKLHAYIHTYTHLSTTNSSMPIASVSQNDSQALFRNTHTMFINNMFTVSVA